MRERVNRWVNALETEIERVGECVLVYVIDWFVGQLVIGF